VIRLLLGELVLLAAGHGALRLGCGQPPVRAYGPLLAAALSWLAGVAALGAVLSLVGVLGGRTTALPVVAPVLGLLALAGVVPVRRADPGRRPGGWLLSGGSGAPGWPRGAAGWLGEAVVTLFALGIGGRTGLAAAHAPALSNDEYAMWMVRGRVLSQLGQLDPRVFAGVDAHYTNLNYPVFLPSLVAWGDRWVGRPSDAAAHLAIAAVLAAAIAVAGIVVTRLAGPLPALAAVMLVAAIPTVLDRQAVLLMGDVPVFAFSLALALTLLWWLRTPHRALLAAAAVLGAGAFGMKVEGSVFTAVAFLGALLLAPAGRRRVAMSGAVALAANLPWLLYSQHHHLRSWIANGDTLSRSHLRQVLPFTGRVLRGVADRWPGGGSVAGALLLAALVPAVVLAVRAGAGRLAAYLGVVVLLDTAVLVVQYVVSAYGPPSDPVAVRLLDGQLDVTVFRVLLLPAALLMIAVPLLAGTALAGPAAPAGPEADLGADHGADPASAAAADPAGDDGRPPEPVVPPGEVDTAGPPEAEPAGAGGVPAADGG
jgi:hypothetical protein